MLTLHSSAFVAAHGNRTALLAALMLLAPLGSAQSPDRLSLAVIGDSMDAIEYPIATVGQGGTATALFGDVDGNTGAAEVDFASGPAVVRLEEVPVLVIGNQLSGVSIGQHFSYSPSGDGSDVRLHYFQPVARDLHFYGPGGAWGQTTSDGESGWLATGDTGATYDFWAHAAELPTKQVVSNYIAFKSGMHVDLFGHGILLRVGPAGADLGETGMHLLIDRKGYGYETFTPAVFAFGVDMPGFATATTIEEVAVENAFLRIRIAGHLMPGDNLIVALDDQPGDIYPAGSLGSTVGSGDSAPCTPPAPTCVTAGTCKPPSPEWGCWNMNNIQCADKSFKIGDELAAGGGSSITQTRCSSWGGGVAVDVTVPLPGGGGFTLSASGEVGGEVCLEVTADGGTRVQAWKCFKECCNTWECSYLTWGGFGPPRTVVKKTCCIVGDGNGNVAGAVTTTTCPNP